MSYTKNYIENVSDNMGLKGRVTPRVIKVATELSKQRESKNE